MAGTNQCVNEVEARRLWALGRQYEGEQKLCCAYEVYQQATKLMTQEQKSRATIWMSKIEQTSGFREAISSCRTLQRSHERFRLGEAFAQADTERALEHYQWIVENAPRDSSVFDAARKRIASY